MSAFTAAQNVLDQARAARIFPAAAAEVGSASESLWQTALGTRSFDAEGRVELATPFDLASLTKPIATTTVVMRLNRTHALTLDEPIARWFPEWRGADRDQVTVRDLLEHASGLPARLVDRAPTGRREFEHDICTLPLEYPPRSRSIYSDLGFILLGFLAADVGASALDRQFAAIWNDPLLTFDLADDLRRQAAKTLPLDNDPRRGRTLAGEVHDDYAHALGGVAGHAGLFGTAGAVARFARALLRAARGADDVGSFTASEVAQLTSRSAVAGSSRALGWDTMLPTSSCGTRMSPRAFGHVGFTGTSLWIDPTRDRYFVLLTNRACGGGTLDAMRTVRREFHDALGGV